jgi:hypothetical protein
MHRLISKITITQVPSTSYPTRDEVFILRFVNNIEIASSWQNLTDTCKITLPKKVYLNDGEGNKINWFGKSIIGSDDSVPVILRGDKIRIELGYNYPTADLEEVEEMNICFDGYITKINPKMPITLECEDRMWQLKQIKTPNKVFLNTEYSVQSMVREMLDAQDSTKDITLITGSLIGQKIETNINAEFRTQDDTIGSVLSRLKKEARLNSYFRNVLQQDGTYKSELRCSGIVYYPSDRETKVFGFQKNIISDDLEFKRVEDIKLGATCYSINKIELTTTNKNGNKKTKHQRLETFVGEPDGELRTLYFWDIQTVDELKELGKRELRKFYYTGFSGKFTTFGLPKVKHGDEVVLIDDILPERNGSYLVKAVRTTFGQEGFRQEIELHLKLSEFTADEIANGL